MGGGDWVFNSSLTSHLLHTYYILGTMRGPRDNIVSKKLTF